MPEKRFIIQPSITKAHLINLYFLFYFWETFKMWLFNGFNWMHIIYYVYIKYIQKIFKRPQKTSSTYNYVFNYHTIIYIGYIIINLQKLIGYKIFSKSYINYKYRHTYLHRNPKYTNKMYIMLYCMRYVLNVNKMLNVFLHTYRCLLRNILWARV